MITIKLAQRRSGGAIMSCDQHEVLDQHGDLQKAAALRGPEKELTDLRAAAPQALTGAMLTGAWTPRIKTRSLSARDAARAREYR
jgi:hypothetical protein